MLKRILRASALASVLAIGAGLPAFAYTEEDAAVPPGAFTSDMAVPMSIRAQDDSFRHQIFEHRMRERMMRRAELKQDQAAR